MNYASINKSSQLEQTELVSIPKCPASLLAIPYAVWQEKMGKAK